MMELLLAAILLVMLGHNAVIYFAIKHGVAQVLVAIREEVGPQWTPMPEGVTHPRGAPDCPHKDQPIYAVHHTGATGCFACATKETA